jgi:DtxR family transcriptional regulator, Mn-dependent transcriptional regulator
MTQRSQQDEYLEQLWYMKENGETTLDYLKSSLGSQFTQEALDEILYRGLAELHRGGQCIRLTDKGETPARQLIRAHRLAERLIFDVLASGDFEKVACEFEHTVSAELVNSICTLLGHPKECPHGMPIPDGECCRISTQTALSFIIPLKDLQLGESARIAYINCKNDQHIHKLDGLCVRPGAVVTLHQNYPTYVIECEGANIALGKEVITNICVWKNLPGKKEMTAGEKQNNKSSGNWINGLSPLWAWIRNHKIGGAGRR